MSLIQKEERYEKERQIDIDKFYRAQGWGVDRSVSCKKYDLKIKIKGRWHTVEEKFRSKDWGDMGVEIVQDAISGNWGWFLTTSPDYLFYIVPERIYVVHWKNFKRWFNNSYASINMKTFISTAGFGLSINVGIKWREIPPSYKGKSVYKTIEING